MSRSVLMWALKNCFRIEDAFWILDKWPQAIKVIPLTGRLWLKKLSVREQTGKVMEQKLARIQVLLSKEIAQYQQRDIRYWSGIIQELREMRRKGSLLPEDSIP